MNSREGLGSRAFAIFDYTCLADLILHVPAAPAQVVRVPADLLAQADRVRVDLLAPEAALHDPVAALRGREAVLPVPAVGPHDPVAVVDPLALVDHDPVVDAQAGDLAAEGGVAVGGPNSLPAILRRKNRRLIPKPRLNSKVWLRRFSPARCSA